MTPANLKLVNAISNSKGTLNVTSSKYKKPITLSDYLRLSRGNPFLKLRPPPPEEGLVYRDFTTMPCALWLKLMDILGDDNIKICAANSNQLPPALKCRAQLFVLFYPKKQKIQKRRPLDRQYSYLPTPHPYKLDK